MRTNVFALMSPGQHRNADITQKLPTFAQNVAIDTFESGPYQGGFDEFLGRHDAAFGFARCHHGKSC